MRGIFMQKVIKIAIGIKNIGVLLEKSAKYFNYPQNNIPCKEKICIFVSLIKKNVPKWHNSEQLRFRKS